MRLFYKTFKSGKGKVLFLQNLSFPHINLDVRKLLVTKEKVKIHIQGKTPSQPFRDFQSNR